MTVNKVKKKEKRNSRDLILKEAFKLFLQKNVEKVTIPDLEKATGIQRGSIFYHFRDKEAIFVEVIERYFFSKLNIFYPLKPEESSSLNDYIERKNENLISIIDWFREEKIVLNPYMSFFHLASQAYLYDSGFQKKMCELLKKDKLYWREAAEIGDDAMGDENKGELFRSIYIEKCFTACYDKHTRALNALYDDFIEISDATIQLK